jgi:hypothetical protein
MPPRGGRRGGGEVGKVRGEKRVRECERGWG